MIANQPRSIGYKEFRIVEAPTPVTGTPESIARDFQLAISGKIRSCTNTPPIEENRG